MKIKINYRKKTFSINAKVCNAFQKLSGLMFSRREKAKILLFEFEKPTKISIHSFFVFFSFVAIWLDSKDKIIDLKIVKPFKLIVQPKEKFSKLIEIPINKQYKSLIKEVVNSPTVTRKI